MIYLSNITKTYKSKYNLVRAIDNTSLTFSNNGLVFIAGKSGCGKTTLLNTLGLIDNVDSGSIYFDGIDVSKLNEKQKDVLRNNKIGFVFQDFNLLSEYNVEENIMLPLSISKKESSSIDEILKEVDLEGFNKRKINELSGGQCQRVAIARALIKKPQVLLCDEPTGSLDSETSLKIFELLKKISKDTLVIVVSHDTEFANKYADRVITIKDGKVISDTTPISFEPIEKTELNKYGRTSFKTKSIFSFRIMKKRPVRLSLAVLSSVISLSILGVMACSSSMNDNQVISQSLVDSKNKYVTIAKQVTSIESGGSERRFTIDGFLEDDDVEDIMNKSGVDVIDKVYNFIDCENLNCNSIYADNNGNGYYTPQISNFVEISESFINRYNFNLVGRLPNDYNEVVISNYEFEIFKKYGYRNLIEDISVKEYSDIIGKIFYLGGSKLEAKDYVICGILDTNLNIERYGSLIYEKNTVLEGEFEDYMKYNIHNAVFFKEGFFEEKCSEFLKDGLHSNNSDFKFYIGDEIIESNTLKTINLENKKIYSKNDNIISGAVLPLSKWIGANSVKEVINTIVGQYAFSNFNEVESQIIKDYPDEYINETFYKNLIIDSNYYDKYLNKDYSYFKERTIDYLLYDSHNYDEKIDSISFQSLFMNKNYLKHFDFVGFIDDLDNPMEEKCYLTEDVYESIIEEMDWILDDYSFIMVPISNNFAKVSKIITCRNFKTNLDKQSGVTGFDYDHSQYVIENEYTFNLKLTKEITSSYKDILKYASVGLMLLSIIMTFLYFSGIVYDTRKELGILRSLGMSKGDIYHIFIINNLVVSICSFVISIIGTFVGCNVTANVFKKSESILTFVRFDVKIVMLILLASLLVALISSFGPIIKANKKKIVNMIKD